MMPENRIDLNKKKKRASNIRRRAGPDLTHVTEGA